MILHLMSDLLCRTLDLHSLSIVTHDLRYIDTDFKALYSLSLLALLLGTSSFVIA